MRRYLLPSGERMLEVDRELAGMVRQAPGAAGGIDNEFAGHLRDLRRWWWVPVLCTIVAAVNAYAISSRHTKEFDATASLLFRDPAIDERLFPGTFFTPSDDPERKAATNVRLVSLDVVARRAATDGTLRLTAAEISKSVRVRADGNSDVVAITARRPTPEAAAALANEYATEYVAFRRDADRTKILQAAELVRRQQARLGRTEPDRKEAETLADRASQLQTLAAVQTGNAEIVERAEPPSLSSPAAPHPKRSAIVGGALGLMVGVGLTLLLSRLDHRLREANEAAALLGVPVLAEVPADRRLAARPSLEWITDAPEAFRVLRTTLRYFSLGDEGVTTILVTSAAPGEGKTTSSWNLAVAAASDGDSVLLVEADLRRPRMLPELRNTGAGLAPLLAGLTSFEQALTSMTVRRRDEAGGGGRVDVLAAGECPPNPLQLLQSKRMQDLLQDVRRRYDLVVIDSPAINAVADALALVRDVDGVVVVTRLGLTTRGDVHTLRRHLDNIAANVLGVVVNGTKERAPGYYYTEPEA
jgi:succinoglycan biosynthesis transport protein ExoP